MGGGVELALCLMLGAPLVALLLFFFPVRVNYPTLTHGASCFNHHGLLPSMGVAEAVMSTGVSSACSTPTFNRPSARMF